MPGSKIPGSCTPGLLLVDGSSPPLGPPESSDSLELFKRLGLVGEAGKAVEEGQPAYLAALRVEQEKLPGPREIVELLYHGESFSVSCGVIALCR